MSTITDADLAWLIFQVWLNGALIGWWVGFLKGRKKR